ncbi:MAG: LapA family protein [Candidatus Aminicenantales bacterium]
MKTKTMVLLAAVGLFIILLIQNSGSVQFNFFFWKISMSQVILAPGVFFLGFLAGYWRAHFGRRRDRLRPSVVPPQPPQPPQITNR